MQGAVAQRGFKVNCVKGIDCIEGCKGRLRLRESTVLNNLKGRSVQLNAAADFLRFGSESVRFDSNTFRFDTGRIRFSSEKIPSISTQPRPDVRLKNFAVQGE